jgi:hypothetical protein
MTPDQLDEQRAKVTEALPAAWGPGVVPTEGLLEAITEALVYIGDALRRLDS